MPFPPVPRFRAMYSRGHAQRLSGDPKLGQDVEQRCAHKNAHVGPSVYLATNAGRKPAELRHAVKIWRDSHVPSARCVAPFPPILRTSPEPTSSHKLDALHI